MENLNIQNSRFITYKDEVFTVDVLGGVDTQQIERMICTLRITYQNYPPLRSTLDLYNDNQTDKLIRTLCDKWELQLLSVSKSVHSMIAQLESYKLYKLQYPKQKAPDFEPNQEQTKTAKAFLRSKNLANELIQKLNKIGILGEDENALILFLALASYKFYNPFSVICLAKSGIGKSYILQKLSECMPKNAYSFHTKISANALYYFDSHQINSKALFIEDLEWTSQMLQPLATLQTQGKLVSTRATKDKDGMLHSTTFEVVANLCLLACAYSEKNFEEISLPFLCLHLNHSHAQDLAIMDYQRRASAGLLNENTINETTQLLQCVIATLQNIRVINPFAPLISLPEEVSHPRKSFLVLLNFIEVITYFFQYQREQTADEQTGEVLIKTHPNDIALAFKLLKSSLFRRADELSTTARGFYNWLKKYLTEAKTNQFTALDIRKAKPIHPRTLNNYLNELKLFGYVQITGGNKHREGYRYKLSEFGNQSDKQSKIEQSINATLKKVWNEYNKQQGKEEQEEPIKEPEPMPEAKQEPPKAEPTENGTEQEESPTFFEKNYKRIRINEKEKHTFKILLQLEEKEPNREYQTQDITAITGRSQCIEARYLKNLWEQGKLNREWKDRRYFYSLTPDSRQESQNPLSDTQSQEQ